MADGKSCAKLLLPIMGIFLLVCPVIHSSEDKRLDTGRTPFDGRLPRKILEDIKKIKCPASDINSLNPHTVLLAQLLDNSSDSDSNSNHTGQQVEKLVFSVDSSVLDFNISALGWRFRLWNIRDTPQPSNQAVPCLKQVVESGPDTCFEFQELREERKIKRQRSEESEQRQRPGSDGGCREFTSDTCIERIDLGGGHGEDDGDDEASGLRSLKSCPGSLSISSPDPGLRYLELFRDPGARTAEVTVKGQSYLHFHFNFSIPITALPVLDPPIAGDMYIIELTFSCRDLVDFDQSRLLTLSESGQVLDDGVVLQEGVNVITIPHQNFYIGVEGVNVYGEKFVRISPELVRPRLFVISFTTPAHTEDLHPKQNLDVRIRLRNQDKADTFSVTASFSAYTDYLTAKISPKVLSVKEGGYKEIHIVISVHESISQKIISLLTIEVKRHSDASLTSLTRDVTATPDSFGEDAEPPSCSTIYESSQCDHTASTNCSDRIWEAGVLVDDLSGVYRAFFSTPLMSSIAYLQAHGKLMAQALVRRDCCSPNATLLVEDYMGNRQTCTLEAPTFNMNPHKTQRQPGTSDVKSIGKSATDTKMKFLKENTTQLSTEKNVTATTEARGNKYNKDEGGLWTPKLLAKIKTLGIVISCLLFLILCYWIIKVALNKELKNGKAKGTSRSPAFHFRTRLSRQTSQKGQTRSDNVQMARPEESLVSALPMSLIKKPNVFRVMQATRINKAFCQENISDEGPVLETFSQNVNSNQDGGGISEARDVNNDSTSYASLADSRCDEAYSSFRGSMKSTNLQKETSMSQMSISDLEPRNKTEMYERIVQCRDLLEELERKRAVLMNSADLKHHTVPRIRQHDVKTEPYFNIDKTPGNPCGFVHGKRGETGNKRSESFGVQREGEDQVSTDWTKDSTLEDDTKQATSSPVSTAKSRKNISSSSKVNHQTDIDKINLSAGRKKATSDVKMQKKVDGVAGEIRNAATPPELSQGHVSNLIEGATQISLRHEIQRLRERLLEYSKVVEDEIHFKKDLCERLSLAGEQVDSDFEEI